MKTKYNVGGSGNRIADTLWTVRGSAMDTSDIDAILPLLGDKAGKKAKIIVILPDAGNPYLGKVYNDDWLRENGFDVDGWEW